MISLVGTVRSRETRSGFALVAVLSVMALLSGMLLGLALWSRNSVENAAVAASDLRSDMLGRSAAAVAAYQLFVLRLPRERVDNQQIALDDGTATITLGDESGKVDLNRSDKPLLAAAYRAAGLSRMTPEAFAARVADWRDEDDTASEAGAETPAYRSAGLPPPRNGDFRTLSDLRWVIGMDAAEVATLAPFVTVFNPNGRLNPYAAAQSLIRAVPDLSATSFAQIMALTEAPRTEQNLARLQSILTTQPLFTTESADTVRLNIYTKLFGSANTRSFQLTIAHVDKGSSPVSIRRGPLSLSFRSSADRR